MRLPAPASTVCAALALAGALPPRAARAAGSTEHRVDFSAERIELDADDEWLVLERAVRVRSGRYRLTSERLRLSRGPLGVVVEGGGRLAACPCPDPPITLGFSSVTFAPPTDVLVEDPTVRIGGIPVLWLPWLWLRSPDRAGLLPPTVRYSGEEGFGVGAGVHLPYGPPRADGPRDAVAVGARAYDRGGYGVDALQTTPRSTLRLEWERAGGTRLVVDGVGAWSPIPVAAGALRVDVARGDRARVGEPRLEPAARRYDRGEAALHTAGGAGPTGGVGMELTAARGGGLGAAMGWGPRASAAHGWGLGRGAAGHLGVEVSTVAEGDAASSLAWQHGALQGAAFVGPLRLRARAAEGVGVATTSVGATPLGLGRLELGVGAPLERRFGAGPSALAHRVTPEVVLAGALHGAEPERAPEAPPRAGALLGGFETALGYPAGGAAAAAFHGGAVAREDARVEALVLGALDADSGSVGASAVAAAEPARRDVHVSARTRLGSDATAHVLLRVAGREAGRAASTARLLRAERPYLAAPWLAADGWTVGSSVIAPWGRALATLAEVDADATDRTWLGLRASVAYRHPCGCLAVAAEVARRVGREGFDAGGTLDLMP
ncbi:MAG: hypothetical protein IT376_22665 [Polyangiaceae bacterium]|nr:hypothetical protein [Polyangiaceae bacterium]